VVGACFIGLVLFLAGLAINLYRRWAGPGECETCGKMSLLVLSIVVLLATAFALSLAEIIAQGKLPAVVDGAWAGQWHSTQFGTPAGIVVIASAAGLLIVAAIGINLLYQRWCGRWSRYAKVDDRRSHSHSQGGRSRALLPVAAKAQVVTTAGTWGEARVVPV
jgi:multisubunit Na+/H+ antiporter MnhG subunit